MICAAEPLTFQPQLGDPTMKGKMKTLLLATAAGAIMTMSMGALAQAPGGGPPGGGPPGGGRGMGMGMGGVPDRAQTIQRNGLDNAALNLTAAQKAEIDRQPMPMSPR